MCFGCHGNYEPQRGLTSCSWSVPHVGTVPVGGGAVGWGTSSGRPQELVTVPSLGQQSFVLVVVSGWRLVLLHALRVRQAEAGRLGRGVLLRLNFWGPDLKEVVVVLPSGAPLRWRRLQTLSLAHLAEEQHVAELLRAAAGRAGGRGARPGALPLQQGSQVLLGQPGVGVAR